MKVLLIVLISLFASSGVFAGLIEADVSWTSIYRDNATQEIVPYKSGAASFIYEEGTNDILSMVFFDESNNAVFSSLNPFSVAFDNPVNPSGSSAIWSGDLVNPADISDVQTGHLFKFGISDMVAITTSEFVLPTLDNWNGTIWGSLVDDLGSISFATSGIQRTPVSSVPEPSSLVLLGLGLLMVNLRSRRAVS